jgi:hypothetical protein
MKRIYLIVFTLCALAGNSQVLTYSSTPDSASQSPRTGSTGTFAIVYSNSVCTNGFNYNICCSNSKSSALYLYRFNLNVPAGASITGVSATYTTTGGNGGATNYKWDSLSLSNNFVTVGTYKRDSINGSGGTYFHGSVSNLWGAALTPSVVNSPHFGLKFHLDTYGINTTIVGDFKLAIHYTMPTAIHEFQGAAAGPVVYVHDKRLFAGGIGQDEARLLVFTVNGQKLIDTTIGTGSAIPLSELSAGIYIYRLGTGLQVKHGKFVLE